MYHLFERQNLTAPKNVNLFTPMIQGLSVADDEHAVAWQDVWHHTNIPGQDSQPE